MKRNYYYDNARFLIVFLVLLVHVISPDRGETAKGVYLNPLTRNDFFIALSALIQLFIMPSIFIISGYFFKKDVSTDYVKSIVERFLIPLIIFDVILKIVTPSDLNPTELFTEPFYILWFLGVIIAFKFLAPFIYRLNLYIALVLILLVSFTPHFEYNGLQWGGVNLIKYLPYYIIGMIFKTNSLDLSQFNFKFFHRFLAAIFFLTIFISLYHFKVDFNEVLPEGDDEGYIIGIRLIAQKYSLFKGIIIDITYRILTLILCFCFFILVPKLETFFTKYGNNTMYPYLLHIFLIYFILDKGIKIYSHQPSEWWWYIILFAFTCLMMVGLSSRFIVRPLKPIIAPNLDRFFKFLFKKGGDE